MNHADLKVKCEKHNQIYSGPELVFFWAPVTALVTWAGFARNGAELQSVQKHPMTAPSLLLLFKALLVKYSKDILRYYLVIRLFQRCTCGKQDHVLDGISSMLLGSAI